MPKYITLLCLGLCLLLTQARGSEPHHFHIEWHAASEVQLSQPGHWYRLSGDGIVTQYGTGLLPWYVAAIETENELVFQHPQIQHAVYDTLPAEVADRLVDADLIAEDFYIETSRSPSTLLNEGLLVFTLRKQQGRIERLLSFDLDFETAPNPAPKREDYMPDYAGHSVLATGQWYKIGVKQTGVYKISYADLQQMGIDVASIDPDKVQLYGNGNGMLPEANSLPRIDDLYENAIYVHGAQNGQFNETDYLLFYGLNPVRERYNPFTNRMMHEVNHYTDTTFYFLRVDGDLSGKRIGVIPEESEPPTHETDSYLAYQYHEKDLVNLLSSGREWYGETFSTASPHLVIDFHFPGLLPDQPVHLQTRFVARSVTEDMYFDLEVNGEQIIDETLMRKVGVAQYLYGREASRSANFYADSPNLQVKVNFQANENSSRGWLNHVGINAWCALQFEQGQLNFRNPTVTGLQNISRFHLAGASHNVHLWDVSQPLEPKTQQFTPTANGIQFTVATSNLREYIVFDGSEFLQPVSAVPIPNQNLHGIADAEYLIVTHPIFMEQANELAAFHQQLQGLDTRVVNIFEVYNEFGSGAADISALRDFVRMVYLRSEGNLKYLLLFGGASFDYKDRIPHNTNFVPTYQASESLRETDSWVTDDYFGLMDYDEGEMMQGLLDIGIGRFPVNSPEEGALMVEKVVHYMRPGSATAGDWRNRITFMGDDHDSNLHLNQAETLSRIVDTARNILNINKIYIDAYPRQSVAGGYRFPDANRAIVNQVESGALIVNYTGHGGVNGLTDERVLTIPDIVSFKNYDNMPLFITATCEFSRFDDPEFVSAGERLLLNPNGGSIALMTTTRLAFAHSNFGINRKLYQELFNSQSPVIERLGDAMRKSKNPTSSNVYNFVLLGDPAMRLASPSNRVETTAFNHSDNIALRDTVKALSVVHIAGKIVDEAGRHKDGFNGYLHPKVFDKKTTFRTLGTSSASFPTHFSYYDKLISDGKVSVNNGYFEFEFAVPKDIAYQYDYGRISYYAVDTATFADASGVFNMLIGGIDENVALDHTGPQIELYVNRPDFESGDVLTNDAVIYARIADPQGINYLGVGIGRDLLGYLNENVMTTYILNDFFEPDIDSYTAGSIEFPLPHLADGEHVFRLKAWDLHNNSAEATVHFVIDDLKPVNLSNLHNRPNPFDAHTRFVFEHDKPGEKVNVLIDIFRIDGGLVHTIEAKDELLSGREFHLDWDARDASGRLLPAGMYFYRFLLTYGMGERIETGQKMMIVR